MKTVFKIPVFYLTVIAILFFISVNAQTSQGYNFNSTKTLKEKNGQKLTEGDMESYRFMVEFLLGSPLDKGDKQYLKDDLIKDFDKNPGNVVSNIQSAKDVVNQVNQLPDAMKVGYIRSYFVATLYPMRTGEDAKKLFEWFDKYNPILHYDPVNTLVLTRADLLSFQHLLILSNYVQTGQDYKLTEAEAKQNINWLINEYKTGDNQTKVDLASMQYVYLQVLMAYQQFNASQKQQLAAQAQQQSTRGQNSSISSREKDALMSKIIQMGNISRHNMIETMGSGDKTFYSLDYNSPLSW